MIDVLILAQLAGAPLPMPPQDWSALHPLPLVHALDDDTSLSAFVRSEVKAGRCSAASQTPSQAWTLKIDLAVLMGPSGQPRRVVPRAIDCPSVEQYAAGIVTSLARGNVPATMVDTDAWYRTSLTFSWPA